MAVRAREVLAGAVAAAPRDLQMGLRRLDPAAWLLVTEHYDAEIAAKRRLVDDDADVMACEPGAEPAVAETLALVEAFLGAHHPALRPSRRPAPPLERVGLSVQEDLCWLAPGDGGHRLVAAFVAFPAHWRLADKIGRPLAAIHEPVPGAGARLAAPMERLFAALAVDRPVWRANWSIVDDPQLHQPVRRSAERAGTPAEAMFLRVERQTLRRLPRTGLVLFTIHTLVEPLAAACVDPATARALAVRLEAMAPAMAGYKGLAGVDGGLAAWLRTHAAGP